MKKLSLSALVALAFSVSLIAGPVAAWACGDDCQCQNHKTAQADDDEAAETDADGETDKDTEQSKEAHRQPKGEKKQLHEQHKQVKQPLHNKAKSGTNLVAQPGASVGDKTLCPVSGNEFTVTDSSPSVEHDGKKVYFCCAGCGDKFSEDPEGVLAKHVEKVEEANKTE